jgi:hypothetical protein
VAWAAAVAALLAPRAAAQSTARASVATGGIQSDGNSFVPAISADGRFVAFYSSATNLVPGDTNVNPDIFVRDRIGGTTQRVSVDSAGVEGDDSSTFPSLSSDGRFVAFQSRATNLVPNDINAAIDVFVRDRQSSTTERVSVSTAGVNANYQSQNASISGDGRYVVFDSTATNLVLGDTNGASDIFVRDRQLGTTVRVSLSSGGVQANSSSNSAAISSDGRFVAFVSFATNLTPDTNFSTDVFVRDLQAGATSMISANTAGVQGNSNSKVCSISATGRFVAFVSGATNLVTGDTNANFDVFLRDRTLGTTERVSVGASGTQANSSSDGACSISADGDTVAFESIASNLVAGDNNAKWDIFVRHRAAATTQRVSIDDTGAQGNAASHYVAISSEGRFAVFQSAATLVAGDTNGSTDVYVRDSWPVPVVFCTASTSTNGCSATISANVVPSVSHATACVVTVANVEGLKSGLLFYGLDNSGFQALPWGTGGTSFLCVKQPMRRTPAQNSGGTFGACDGSYTLDWNAFQLANPSALGNPWTPGARVYVQAWYRDPPAPKSTNLSDALTMTYVP